MKYRINVVRTSIVMAMLSVLSACELLSIFYEDDSISSTPTATDDGIPLY